MNALILLSLLSVGPALPAHVPLPPGTAPNVPTFSQTNFDQLKVRDGTKELTVRGRLTRGYLVFVPEGAQQPAEQTAKAWLALLSKQGWSVAGSDGTAYSLKRGKDEWLAFSTADFDQPRVQWLSAGPAPTKLDLKAPAAKAEAFTDTQDFPWLGHFPGSTLSGTSKNDDPFVLNGNEAQLIASGITQKRYTPPPTLSKVETVVAYVEGLKKAGWEIVQSDEAEGTLVAHFSKSGRNVWVQIGRANDDSDSGLNFYVADVGAEDWAKQIDADCHVALRGVNFDFDKSTLKADSTPVLEKAGAVIQARPALQFEVQGHTDNVGDEAYNLKLSGQRADAVRDWLTKHGVPAARLSSKGYGKNQPVTENDTDVGRAKNRRVELACKKN